MTSAIAALGLSDLQGQILIWDDVLVDPLAYRQLALTHRFEDIQTDDELWRGIALLPDEVVLSRLIQQFMPMATTRLTFFRKSPAGQLEPNFIHSDEGMGQWTAILYLNDPPADGDGTAFWRYRPTGEVIGSARALAKDPALWTRWHEVPAKLGRLILFDSWLFHSRAIEDNYGQGDDARLVQVAFGTC